MGQTLVRTWRPPAVPGLEVVRVDDDTQLWAAHINQYNISVMYAGAFDFWYRRRVWSLSPGPIKLSEPGEVHRDLRVDAPVSLQTLEIAPHVMDEAARSLGYARPPHFIAGITRGAGKTEEAALRLHALLAEAAPDSFECESRLTEVLELVMTEYGERAPAPARRSSVRAARRTRDYLHAMWARNISLEALAREVGLNKFHLLRQFRAEFGLPPHEYVTHLRIARARELLASGVSAGRAAMEVGLCDQSQLNRHFKRIVGITPGQYAKAMRPGSTSRQ